MKEVPNIPGLFVDEYGNVKRESYKFYQRHPKGHLYQRTLPAKILKQSKHSDGYLTVSFKGKKYYVHRLVTSTFIGVIPDKYEVNHIDGVTHNNHVSNLEIVNRSEQQKHAYRIGLNVPVPENHRSYDSTVYRFLKLATGESFLGTRYQFNKEYEFGTRTSQVGLLIRGKQKTFHGWIII